MFSSDYKTHPSLLQKKVGKILKVEEGNCDGPPAPQQPCVCVETHAYLQRHRVSFRFVSHGRCLQARMLSPVSLSWLHRVIAKHPLSNQAGVTVSRSGTPLSLFPSGNFADNSPRLPLSRALGFRPPNLDGTQGLAQTWGHPHPLHPLRPPLPPDALAQRTDQRPQR